MATINLSQYDLKKAISKNRLLGIWKLMYGYHPPYILANVSLAVSALFKTAIYLLLRFFVDDILGTPEKNHLLPLIAVGFVVIAVFEGIFSYLSGRMAAYTAENVVQRLRNYLYDHIQRLSLSYHGKVKTGELIQRVSSDIDSIRRLYVEQGVGIGRIIFLFLINFIIIFQLNRQLAIYSIVVIPFVFLISIYFFKKISIIYEEYQNQEAQLSTTLQENLSGVRVVKAFSNQNYEREKFEKDNWNKFLKGKQLLLLYSFFWPLTDTLCGFQMLAGFLIGAIMTINGTISIGTYLAYAGLVIWLIWPMRNLGRLIVQTSEGLVSYNRVMEIIQEDKEPLNEGTHDPDIEVTGEIRFCNVGFKYDDSQIPALKDISFDCKPGQIIALVGSTGSGKTSLVNLLPRFYEYTSGRITLDGIDLNRYPSRYLRNRIGIVEQEPFLFSRTIRENILFGANKKVSQNQIEEVAKAAAIHDVITSFKDGYDTMVGEKGVTLSGGQKQRIAIARALLRNPRILILDDSTSSIDSETEAEIRNALNRLMENRTTFIIAHRIQSVLNADLILVLDQGKIIQKGTHQELILHEGMYTDIHNLQNEIVLEI
jgi:ATP-binding cassette subfamily B protein